MVGILLGVRLDFSTSMLAFSAQSPAKEEGYMKEAASGLLCSFKDI